MTKRLIPLLPSRLVTKARGKERRRSVQNRRGSKSKGVGLVERKGWFTEKRADYLSHGSRERNPVEILCSGGESKKVLWIDLGDEDDIVHRKRKHKRED